MYSVPGRSAQVLGPCTEVRGKESRADRAPLSREDCLEAVEPELNSASKNPSALAGSGLGEGVSSGGNNSNNNNSFGQ